MKTVSHPLFIVLSALYLVYYGLKFTDVELPTFITSYFADLLSIFIVNTLTLWLIRRIKGLPNYEFPISLVWVSVVLFSLFFEVFLPKIDSYYKADWMDVVCYLVSGLGYVVWRKKNLFEFKK